MDNITMNRDLGTKWFTFYTKVRPCFTCFAFLTALVDFQQYADVYINNWWLLLSFAATVAQTILSIAVLIKSRGAYVDFVRFVKGVLLFEILLFAYQQSVNAYASSKLNLAVALVAFILISVLGYFVWYVLNVKYFNKRIRLNPKTSEPDDVPSSGSWQCRCGYINSAHVGICYCGERKPSSKKDPVEKTTPPVPSDDHAAAVNPPRFCRRCGADLIEGGRFCRKCGTPVPEQN